jgi:hypothetical protein
MPSRSPPPITREENRARHNRVARIARRLGFVGRIEYRHVYSRSGGAQYLQGITIDQDLLTIYVEAFQRDADPADFSLNAIVAHERGHQLLAWHPRIAGLVAGRVSAVSEEILASILGAIICAESTDHNNLIGKAVAELLTYCEVGSLAALKVDELKNLLEASYDGPQNIRRNTRYLASKVGPKRRRSDRMAGETDSEFAEGRERAAISFGRAQKPAEAQAAIEEENSCSISKR